MGAIATQDAWKKDLAESEKMVMELKYSLDKYKNAFDFVGLHQGFDDLAKEKSDKISKLKFCLIIMDIFLLIPLIAELSIIYINTGDIESIKFGLLIAIPISIPYMFIAIDYFRILLFNYRSAKTRLMQIDLRKTLCRFI